MILREPKPFCDDQTPLIQQTWCGEYIQSLYLSQILRIIFVEKKLSCGEISAFYTEVSYYDFARAEAILR